VTEQQAKQVTPTDQIPFTRGMAATIAAGLDHAGAHTSATDVRKQAGLVTTPERKLPEGVWVQKFRDGWYVCKDSDDRGWFRVFRKQSAWSGYCAPSAFTGADGHPTASAALAAYWKWHDEQSENAKEEKREPVCPQCGHPGSHFVPPSLGEPGFYYCRQENAPAKIDHQPPQPAQSPPTLPEVDQSPKPYTEATRWACADSLPHTNDYRIFKGKVQFNPSINGEQWRDDNDRYTTVESFLSAEQRGEVVRVGEKGHIAEVSKMVPEWASGTYLAGYAAAESKAGDTIAALQSRVKELEEAVRVLGAECNNKRDVCLGCSTAPNYIQVTEEETDANPIARASLEAARKEGGAA